MKTTEMISKIKSSSLKKGREEEFLNCVLNKMENTNHLSIGFPNHDHLNFLLFKLLTSFYCPYK